MRILNLNTAKSVKHGGGCVILTVLLSRNGTGAFPQVNGIMKEDYLQIFQLDLNSTGRWREFGHIWTIQPENDPKHASK